MSTDAPVPESEALSALNARVRRNGRAVQLMEASIEANAKKRRKQEGPMLGKAQGLS